MLTTSPLWRLAPLVTLLLITACQKDDESPDSDADTFEKTIAIPADYLSSTDIAALTDGSVFVLGATKAGGFPQAQRLAGFKLTAAGDTVWTRRYIFGAPSLNYGAGISYSCLATPDGNVVFSAMTPTATGDFHPRLTKLNAITGAVLWTLELPDNVFTTFCKIAITADGGFLLVNNVQENEFRLHTITAAGALLSSVSIPSGFASDICPTADGNFMVASVVGLHTQQQPKLTKITPQGTVLWTRPSSGSGFGIVSSVVQTPDGGYVLASGNPYTNVYSTLKLLKANANGQEEFIYQYSDVKGYANQLGVSSENKLILAGTQNTGTVATPFATPLVMRLTAASGSEELRQANLQMNGDITCFTQTRDKLLFLYSYAGSKLVLRKTNADITY
jgi:hypothetical protein